MTLSRTRKTVSAIGRGRRWQRVWGVWSCGEKAGLGVQAQAQAPTGPTKIREVRANEVDRQRQGVRPVRPQGASSSADTMSR